MTLPLWRDKICRRNRRRAGRQTRRAGAAHRRADQSDRGFCGKSFDYREINRNLDLLQEQLIPKAQQSLEIARAAYLAGKTDFFNLIDAERTLLEFRLSEIEARTQRELVLWDLSLLIAGVPPAKRRCCRRTARQNEFNPILRHEKIKFILFAVLAGGGCCRRHFVRQKIRPRNGRCLRNQDALHLRHAPAGHPGSSRQLPDLRHEAHARPQTGRRSATATPGERKIKYYKSTMNPGETSPQPGKDSMGMDMVPVYEDDGQRIPGHRH